MKTKITNTEWTVMLKTIDAFTNRIYAACEAVKALGDFNVYMQETKLDFDYEDGDIDQEAQVYFNFVLNWVGTRKEAEAPRHEATLVIACGDKAPSIEYLTGYIQCLLESEEIREEFDE